MENNKSDTQFVSGMFLNKVAETAPAWVITNQSIHMETLFKWLQANKGLADEKGYIRIVGKESKEGKRYFQVDTYKPKAEQITAMNTTFVGGEGKFTAVPEGKGIDMSEFTGEAKTEDIPF